MPRSSRPYAPFEYYHVLNRGVNRESIFRAKNDYLRFLDQLEESRRRFDWIVYSYCLMNNHYHLHIQTRNDPLATIMSSLQTSHSLYMNIKYRRSGVLFQNRFKSILIQKDPYHLQLSKYIHLNPVQAGLVRTPQEYPYSSYGEIIKHPLHQHRILDRRVIKSLLGSFDQKAVTKYRQFVEESDTVDYDPTFAVRNTMGSTRFRSQFE